MFFYKTNLFQTTKLIQNLKLAAFNLSNIIISLKKNATDRNTFIEILKKQEQLDPLKEVIINIEQYTEDMNEDTKVYYVIVEIRNFIRVCK